MATFTFGAGNARKLLGLPLYGLSAIASVVVPRSAKLWVFGSGIGLGEGALPLYRRARERFGDDVRLVWMARSRAELVAAREIGLTVVRKGGWRGFWTTLRAKVIVVTHGFGDANRYGVRGGFVVQLWHGLPFKHLHLDSPSTYRVSFLPDIEPVRRAVGWAYRRAGRGIWLFPVASERVKDSIVSGFGVPPDRVAILGDVRDDILLAPNARQQATATLHELVPDAKDNTVVLFAPTWRDGQADPTVPSPVEWRSIAAWLDEHQALLIVRNHPLGRGDFAGGPQASPRVTLLGQSELLDLNAILPAVDAVVTDYSSLAFDAALADRPVVHFTPDVAAYTSSRGFYLPVEEFTGGRQVTTWDATLTTLEKVLAEPSDGPGHQHAAHLRHEFFDVIEPGAADRVLDQIRARLAAEPAPEPPLLPRPTVQALDFHQSTGALRITGVSAGALVGRYARVEAQDSTFPLLQSRWGSAPLALPTGRYRLQLPGGSTRVAMAAESLAIEHELFHATVEASGGGLTLDVRPPLTGAEIGPSAQRRLEKRYRRQRQSPEDAVFFESYRGRTAACNPLGIDRVIASERPDTRRYWSVVDGSVEIPSGAVRLIEGSQEWWRVRASARVLVVNDWLRKRWKRRSHQHVLQTWHGSTLKRLARDRPHASWRSRVAARREGRRWDRLLAQNEFSASNLRSAYAFTKPIWVEGYPRNDTIVSGAVGQDVRRRLGISADVRVMLWAPTWRENRAAMVDDLDIAGLAHRLGPDWVVLVRGHVNTWASRALSTPHGVLDVTTYPDISDLLSVTDVLVTDYSSVMFDWMVTRRPIVFFVPDLEHYAQQLRGFYADLLTEAPGPVVRTTDGVVASVLDLLDHPEQFADALSSWRARFTEMDDGLAGERVVQRMLDEGWLS
ncbi:MAG TPA: CDP-glycerol glycerophosphotransferase family protein [Aeromicrobium sp.]|nr:CDP-glycerol glycerophosphotransferase family protein [Aeromicrobium sp.]